MRLTRLFLFIFLSLMNPIYAQMSQSSDQGKRGTLPTDVPGQHSATRLVIDPPVVMATSDDKSDHLAKIFDFKGDVRILKKGSEEWKVAGKGMLIEVGDQVLTGRESYLDISYDNYYLNVARIEQNTKAEFLNIEPTIVRLEDGSIFSALDGLEKNQGYQIATPTAVAAVRGTHFEVSFIDGLFSAATFNQGDDASHFIEVTPILPEEKQGQPIELKEDFQIEFSSPELVSPELLVKLDPVKAAEGLVRFNQMTESFDEVRSEGFERFDSIRHPERSEGSQSEILRRFAPQDDGSGQLQSSEDDKAIFDGGNPPPSDGGGSLLQNEGFDNTLDQLLMQDDLLLNEYLSFLEPKEPLSELRREGPEELRPPFMPRNEVDEISRETAMLENEKIDENGPHKPRHPGDEPPCAPNCP